ncbi:MAG: MmcQ/YjbR family DNA-binding protein [Spirochaetales bacterium]|nr:MmcQ/YjbR family DNA-binding protein [Spirochaetales bacterium]
MTVEEFKASCYTKKGVSEGFPFDDDTLVMKVGTKMFACGSLSRKPFKMNLKCDPEMVYNLRDSIEEIEPGWHMNKAHWNTVNLEGNLDRDKIEWLIDLSYDLVFKKLKKSEKDEINSGS